MGSPHEGGSASSGEHEDGSSHGRGSDSESLGTFNACEVDFDLGGRGGGHWCSWWLILVLGGTAWLASLDGPPGGILGGTGLHPDSGSTAAESGNAYALLLSLWSPVTVGEGLLTSGSFVTGHDSGQFGGDERLDGDEILSSLDHGLLEGLSVGIVLGDLAFDSTGGEGLLGLDNIALGGGNTCCLGVEIIVLCLPESLLLGNVVSQCLERSVGEHLGKGSLGILGSGL